MAEACFKADAFKTSLKAAVQTLTYIVYMATCVHHQQWVQVRSLCGIDRTTGARPDSRRGRKGASGGKRLVFLSSDHPDVPSCWFFCLDIVSLQWCAWLTREEKTAVQTKFSSHVKSHRCSRRVQKNTRTAKEVVGSVYLTFITISPFSTFPFFYTQQLAVADDAATRARRSHLM